MQFVQPPEKISGGFCLLGKPFDRVMRSTNIQEACSYHFVAMEKPIPKKYVYRKLQKEERRALEQILLEQMDAQTWYSIALIQEWQKEVFLTLN